MKNKPLTIVMGCAVGLFLAYCKTPQPTIAQSQEINYIPYYLKVYEADSLYIVKNYQSSYAVLDDLFKKYEILNIEVYNEYETYTASSVATNHTKDIRKMVQNCFAKYGSLLHIFKQDSLLNRALVLSKFSDADIAQLYEEYRNNLDLELRHTVEIMLQQDQQCRIASPFNMDTMKKVDRINRQKLQMILAEKGYPNRKKIGGYSLNQKDVDIGTLFLHADPIELAEELLPKLKQYVINGDCKPDIYAGPFDKLMLSYGAETQLYGTMNKNYKELMPLEYPKKLDSLRKSIGLPHIGYSKWRLKTKYNASFDPDEY